jgi:hypothetical protein
MRTTPQWQLHLVWLAHLYANDGLEWLDRYRSHEKLGCQIGNLYRVADFCLLILVFLRWPLKYE